MKLVHVLLTLPFLVSCAASSPAPGAPNELSAEEAQAGWQLLFDGTSTRGWRAYRGKGCPDGWKAVDGALTRVAQAGDIVTQEEFADFELSFDWRIEHGGNSGLMFRVTEDHAAPWETGPEYQLLDDVEHANGLDPTTSAGANYAMHAPQHKRLRPVGEWNTARLRVVGPHVEHWLNGKKIVEYELWSPDWEERVKNCKWNTRPDYGRRKSGRIALQDHDGAVAFRNLKIRRL
jgi:hypothetical protein